MNPHKRTIQVSLCLLVVYVAAQNGAAQARQPPSGRRGIVVDERLAAVRGTPQLNGRLVRRLSRGRQVAIRGFRTTPEGVVFLFVNVTSRTRGWIQREAVVSPGQAGDDRRLLDLIEASLGFDRIVRARIFLDHFPRSPLRPKILLLLGNTAQAQAAKLSRDAAKRLNGTLGSASKSSYFMNYSGLDRYNRQRVGFVFNRPTGSFDYDGAAWRELIRRYPNTPEATEARKRLGELAAISQ